MTLTLDELRNGLAPEKDLVFAEQPSDPEMRESTSIWMFDEEGRFGFPRTGIEAEAHSWDNRMFQANFAFADGRVLNGAERGPAHSPIGPDGRPTVLGAGPLRFECLEPFRRWKMSFDGPAVDTTVEDEIHERVDRDRKANVKLEAEIRMVTPAWIQDTGSGDGSAEAEYMGLGYRFEHLFRAEGVFTHDGGSHPFKATGLRIKRQSIRRLEGFYGHCWQSAVFPDGRAFGCIAYPPKPDGSQYNIGYIYQDGRMHPARSVETPWLRRLLPSGDDVSLVLESELGRTRIHGSTTLANFHVGGNSGMPGLALQQSGARYTWEGQTAIGMIERSSAQDQVRIG
jgi:prepilin-type processing-associated H-X9-DG protein